MSGCIYRFGDHRLDPARRELWCRDTPVQLQAKSFDCIAYLIEHRDRAVGRDELVSAVWGKVEVQGSLLRQTILQARRALRYDGTDQEPIQTVPNFGYRWNQKTSVEEIETSVRTGVDTLEKADSGPAPQTEGQVAPSGGPVPTVLGRRSGPIKWLSMSAVLLLIVGIWSRFDAGSEPAEANPHPHTPACADGATILEVAAVLPVTSQLGDDRMSWVRLGVMESIVARLVKSGLSVVPSEDIIALSRSVESTDLAEAVRGAICVRHLVIPQVERTGSEWTARLEMRSIGGENRMIEAHDVELLAAARNAADHLLVLLGHATAAESSDPEALKADELFARIQIALITDDIETAGRLIDSAPVGTRALPEFRRKELDLMFRRGEFDAVQESLIAMLDEPETKNDPPFRAKVLTALALIRVHQEEPEAALALLGDAIGPLKSPEQLGYLGNTYNTRGLAHAMLGHYEQASSDFAAARLAFTATGRMALLAMVDSNEGLMLLSRNRPAEAYPLLEQSAERAVQFNYYESLAFTIGFLGEAHIALLRPAEALAVFDRFGSRLADLNDSYKWCQYEYHKARALIANGRLSEARLGLDDMLQGSVEFCRRNGLAQVALARLDLMESDAQSAFSRASQAVGMLEKPIDARERAEAWLLAVRALRLLNADSKVESEIERFGAWAAELNDPAAKLQADLASAEQSWHERRFEQGRALYEEALRLALTEGVPADVSLVASSYGHSLIATGDLDHANWVAAHVARWADRDFDSAVLLAAVHATQGQREQWLAHLNQARVLAGERSLPASISEMPRELLSNAVPPGPPSS